MGTSKVTCILTLTGAEVFQIKYEKVTLSKAFWREGTDDEVIKKIPARSFWKQSPEIMADIINNGLQELRMDLHKMLETRPGSQKALKKKHKAWFKIWTNKLCETIELPLERECETDEERQAVLEEQTRFVETQMRVLIERLQVLPSRATGDARNEIPEAGGVKNITKAQAFLPKMNWQIPYIISMEREACYCAFKAREMTFDLFVEYAVANKIPFQHFNGIECGNGSCEGGRQGFDYSGMILYHLQNVKRYSDIKTPKCEPLMKLTQFVGMDMEVVEPIWINNQQNREAMTDFYMRMQEITAADIFDDEGQVTDRFQEFVDYILSEDIYEKRRRRLAQTCYRKTAVLNGLMDLIEIERRR